MIRQEQNSRYDRLCLHGFSPRKSGQSDDDDDDDAMDLDNKTRLESRIMVSGEWIYYYEDAREAVAKNRPDLVHHFDTVFGTFALSL